MCQKPFSMAQTMLVILLIIPPLVPTMVLGRTTAEGQRWLPLEIGLIIEVPDIGTPARITSGSRDIGAGGTANTFGSEVTTESADTDRANSRTNRTTRLIEPSPSAPNENEGPSQDSLIHSVRFGGN